MDRQTLLHEVWGYNSSVTTHTLENPHLSFAAQNRVQSEEAGPVSYPKWRLSP